MGIKGWIASVGGVLMAGGVVQGMAQSGTGGVLVMSGMGLIVLSVVMWWHGIGASSSGGHGQPTSEFSARMNAEAQAARLAEQQAQQEIELAHRQAAAEEEARQARLDFEEQLRRDRAARMANRTDEWE